MKKNTLISTFIAGVLLSSCTSEQESNSVIESIDQKDKIELVNNEKWLVNEEMMVHIENMKSDIDSSSNQENPDYKAIGSKLNSHINLLTSNCTMTGKAHDELHKWLLPFIENVGNLNKATSKENQKSSFESIETAIKEFDIYFK